ncbi:hypothetical protein B5807_07598 [Epicoccum nigrum]|uniref:NAD(P)-binding protein n=1 Tax=Epicoccum nigrum TaxID=105696 RepID=A0A1Y2LZ63_EPING|nr:hypothetical protein B5807_07598 [Epicoccum nigrum]
MDAIKNALFSNTFDPDTEIPDLSGKVYVVTGGSAGIGFGIVAHLLQHNAQKIYLLSQSEQHAAEAQEALKHWGDNSRVDWRQCNLESFKQTDQVARALSKELDRLDALICNAGLGVGVYNESEDGLDTHMQVNHFAQAHLMLSLLPILQKTPDSRLVAQSSDMHRPASSDIKFASVEEINQDIGAMQLYNRTKLAQVVFFHELVLRIKAGQFGQVTSNTAPPWINATHPGGVVTDQQDQAVEAYGTIGKIGVAVARPLMKDPVKQGCRPALFAATHPDIVKEQVQGRYIVPDRKVIEPSDQSKSPVLGLNLWKLTKQVLEQKIGNLSYTMQDDEISPRHLKEQGLVS